MTGLVQQAPAWSVLVAVPLVLSAAVLAGSLDAVLDPRGRVSLRRRVLRPAYEVSRSLLVQRRSTTAPDRLLWGIGVLTPLLVAVLMAPVVPLGSAVVSDLGVGLVWFNAMDVLLWAGWWLAGWGPNSVYSLVGGYRFLAHGLGYELPLMFALVAPAIAAESLNVGRVAAAQEGLWFAVWMPVAFLVYLLGVAAFSVWGPFAPAIGTDVAGGARAELSGVDRLVFEAGRYALLAAGAAFAVPMFLGGGAGPLLPGWAWVLVKTVALLAVLVWLRRRLPAFRPDKFMEVGWMLLLPAVLLQDLVVAVIAVWRS